MAGGAVLRDRLPVGGLVLLVVAAEAADLAAHVEGVADVVLVGAPLDVHLREDVPAPDVAERLAGRGDRVLLLRRHLRVGLRVEVGDRLRDALARRLVARVLGLEGLQPLAADERQRGVDPPVEEGGVELARRGCGRRGSAGCGSRRSPSCATRWPWPPPASSRRARRSAASSRPSSPPRPRRSSAASRPSGSARRGRGPRASGCPGCARPGARRPSPPARSSSRCSPRPPLKCVLTLKRSPTNLFGQWHCSQVSRAGRRLWTGTAIGRR